MCSEIGGQQTSAAAKRSESVFLKGEREFQIGHQIVRDLRGAKGFGFELSGSAGRTTVELGDLPNRPDRRQKTTMRRNGGTRRSIYDGARKTDRFRKSW